MKAKQLNSKIADVNRKIEGRVLPPLILWMLGVPGIVVIALWVLFFRN